MYLVSYGMLLFIVIILPNRNPLINTFYTSRIIYEQVEQLFVVVLSAYIKLGTTSTTSTVLLLPGSNGYTWSELYS